MAKMHYLFFDCETGGLNPNRDSLLTAYFGVYDENLNLIDELDLQLKPSKVEDLVVQPEALKVTGINIQDHLSDPQTITYAKGAVKLLELFARNRIPNKRRSFRPCGQNIDFDINFIKAQLMKEEDWVKSVHHNKLDTLNILTFLQDCDILPVDLGKLESMVTYFGLPLGSAHNAKEDTKMTVEVYKAMLALIKSQKVQMSGGVSNSLLEIIEE